MSKKKEPFELPDEECERLTRNEVSACRMIMALTSELMYAKTDLRKRLESIPYGRERMDMLLGNANSLFIDIIGTISDRQRRMLRNTAKDYDISLKPKMSFDGNRIMFSASEVKELTDCAREKCKSCTDTGEEARKCRLYKWLETNIPLDDYGDDLMCPYANIDWRD